MDRTVPERITTIPIQTIRIDVVGGRSRGLAHVAKSERLTIGVAAQNDVVVDDPKVSRIHAELLGRDDGVLVTDQGSTNGTFVGPVRIERAVVPPGTSIRLGDTTVRVGDGERIDVRLHEADALCGLRGRAPAMRRLMAQIERVAAADIPVLLQGESGTGKEVIARALHDLSPRANAPFVTVDCGSLIPTLVASELFGHERGAFTGATDRRLGAFELAHQGTVFLDELGELPPSIQAALLGVLERRRFRRLGGKEEISVDVRVICATNRDLRAAVNDGAFRLDLYYRIAVAVVLIPPLRERPEDVPLLVEHFLREAGHDGPVSRLISDAAMASLTSHHWPGNVRELRNVIEATTVLGQPPALGPTAPRTDNSPPEAGPDPIGAVLGMKYKDARKALLGEFEVRYLTRLIEAAKDNVSLAARKASMDRSHLIELLRRHGLR